MLNEILFKRKKERKNGIRQCRQNRSISVRFLNVFINRILPKVKIVQDWDFRLPKDLLSGWTDTGFVEEDEFGVLVCFPLDVHGKKYPINRKIMSIYS